jgi:hypothetical protein
MELDLAKVSQAANILKSAGSSGLINQGGWSFENVSKIIGDIKELMHEYNIMRGAAAPGQGGNIVYSNPPRDLVLPPKKNEVAELPAPAAPNGGSGMNLKPLLAYFIPFLEKCIRENPDMTIGEAITKVPDKAADVLALLKMLQAGIK